MEEEVKLSRAAEQISTLVERYRRVLAEGKEHEFNEAKVRTQFINDFLEALGWDVRGKKDSDEVIPEKRTTIGPVDFSLQVNGKEKIFFEIKKFSEELSGSRTVRGRKETFAEQAIHYTWHKNVEWAVLTNFKELRLYFTKVKKPEEGLIFSATFDEYLLPEKLSKIGLLSKKAVLAGLLDREEKRRTRKDIDVAVLEDLFESRKLLTRDVYGKYKGVDTELIKEGIQRILDRLIVMRFMEDKGIEQAESLLNLLDYYSTSVSNTESVPFMRYLKNKFEEFNVTYNSRIFEPHECDRFAISNKTLQTIIQTLYKYNFDWINSDVLGNIYEDYLGHVLEEKGRFVEVVEKHAIRKEHGIYYTPTYVVDYIVKNTVGALIEEKKERILKEEFGGREEKQFNEDERRKFGKLLLSEINMIKILDPACGSGSFLIKAFDVIKEYYDAYGVNSSAVMSPEKKILLNNIHGVDLDRQATEIASVNLILKALKKGQKLPLILDENIRNGNSLISGSEEELREYFGDDWKEKKPFNWEEEFKEIFENGEFDVVIGNPPYVRQEVIKEDKEYLFNRYQSYSSVADLYVYFIEQSIENLKENGYFSFIVSNKFTRANYGRNLRRYILNNAKILQFIDFKDLPVFRDATAYPCIIVIKKEKVAEDKHKILVCNVEHLKFHNFNTYVEETKFLVPQEYLTEKEWIFEKKEVLDLLRSIDSKGIKLREYCGEPLAGIKTGLNEVLIVDEKKRNQIVGNNSYEMDLFVPIIMGRDIKKWNIDFKNRYLIHSEGKDIQDYPNTLKYLSNYKARLENRSDIKDKNRKWYELRPCKYYGEFTKPKIVYPDIADDSNFTYDDEGFFVDMTGFIIPKADKYLVALLNSKLIKFYFSHLGAIIRGNFYRFKTFYMNEVPIYPATPLQQKPLIELADKMLILNKQYNETLSAFNKILENMSDSTTKQLPLKEYFPSSDYGISAVDSQKLLDVRLTGKVTKLEVLEQGDDIIIRGVYIPGEKETGTPISDDILKIRFTDKTLKKFFYYSIKKFLIDNSKKKMWGRGRIVDSVLKAIKIPRFYNLKIKDVEKIRELMDEFFKASPIGDKNLSDIEREIEETDQAIDKKVYELYGLTPEEIKVVEGDVKDL